MDTMGLVNQESSPKTNESIIKIKEEIDPDTPLKYIIEQTVRNMKTEFDRENDILIYSTGGGQFIDTKQAHATPISATLENEVAVETDTAKKMEALSEFRSSVKDNLINIKPSSNNIRTSDQVDHIVKEEARIEGHEICSENWETQMNANFTSQFNTSSENGFEDNICSNKTALNKNRSEITFLNKTSNSRKNKSNGKNNNSRKDKGSCILKNKHKCSECSKTYSSIYYLKLHSTFHTGTMAFECDICKKRFTHKNNLKVHLSIHTGEKLHSCEICNVSLSERELRKHFWIHKKGNLYSCNVCKRDFKKPYLLRSHYSCHTGSNNCKCNICNKYFPSKYDLDRHIPTHTGKKPYKCMLCNTYYTQKSTLKKHWLYIHNHYTRKKSLTVYKCNICCKEYKSRAGFIVHNRNHAGEKPFACDVCNKKFVSKNLLKYHCQLHTGDRPFKCELCKKTYRKRYQLKYHYQVHREVKYLL